MLKLALLAFLAHALALPVHLQRSSKFPRLENVLVCSGPVSALVLRKGYCSKYQQVQVLQFSWAVAAESFFQPPLIFLVGKTYLGNDTARSLLAFALLGSTTQ